MDFASPRAAREMYSRAAWTIAFAAVLYYINRAEYPGPAAVLASVIVLIGGVFVLLGYAMTWFATEGQRKVQEQILDALQLQGSERVLSLSHELGMEAAKRLKSGKVIALGETAENEVSRDKAKTAGLIEQIRFEPGDVTKKLSYPDANFDVVLSSRAFAGLDAAKVVRELARVLRPGGRLMLHESDHIPMEALSQAKLIEITVVPTSLPLGLGGQLVSARK